MQKVNAILIQQLIEDELNKKGKRALCRELKISPTSLYNYLDNISIPTMETIEKMSAYFRKPISFFS